MVKMLGESVRYGLFFDHCMAQKFVHQPVDLRAFVRMFKFRFLFWKNSLLSAVSDDHFFSALRRCSVDRALFWRKGERTGATVDGRHPANQLRLVVYQVDFMLQGFIHSRWYRISSISTISFSDKTWLWQS